MPLSWLLDNWDDGLDLLSRIVYPGLDKRKKLTLATAFHIRKEEFTIADENLRILKDWFKDNLPHEVDLMESYVSMRLDKQNRFESTDHRKKHLEMKMSTAKQSTEIC